VCGWVAKKRGRSIRIDEDLSSCGSEVDDNGQCYDGEFKLDTASVVAGAAVERKEVRRVRPLLSELQVPDWQELAVDRRKWRKMSKRTDIV
jgi:hypothetical protein